MNTQTHKQTDNKMKRKDLVGIGIGPFNLSIAALCHDIPELDVAFFDQKKDFCWHPGMMLPNTYLQTSFLKDLVTAVNPQSPFSFLSYLVSKKRFYAFLNNERPAISRHEYNDYLQWVSRQIEYLHFNQGIESVDFKDDHFEVALADSGEVVAANNLCLGTGKRPHIPQAVNHLHDQYSCFHAINMANLPRDFSGKRVTVIGGGQSGAEIFLHLLQGQDGMPAEINWISRRSNFLPMDETCFTNEWFSPNYIDSFFPLPSTTKHDIVGEQKLASDGISGTTLQAIYETLYEKQVAGENQHYRLCPNRDLIAAQKDKGYRLEAHNKFDGSHEEFRSDVIILATGFENVIPSYLESMKDRLQITQDQQFILNRDYSIEWDGPSQNKIYAVNAGRYSHGISEPQMSLMCWRSATIVNDLLGRDIFDLNDNCSFVEWGDSRPVSALEKRLTA
ncbi:lysine N(6)-hydroxylase/L-ornithine N(5)-oxygenase family protein [Kangiella koreensis]|uniref:L-lysine 6-monooxygenase (NADPH) n=1 Tax=Kangiella koreensis (strain DSM 16069 / JCM 12317 / KCTC 12182 / SW-125) TaxID=523791 RepID=C7R6Z4_KANKD|nr:SidA/IucD/PvdA family monooxygenase [Kangiella koreensis]ACV27450.1 L-lysine 6-monooxygenase (NADPH) [Kangiella koreensis DSM 16069]